MADIQISATFTDQVREWVHLNDVKAQAAKDISKMIKRIKELKKGIMTYMSAHEIGTVNISGERVKLIHTKSKEALSEEVLNDLLGKYFKENGDSSLAAKADQIAHYIMEKRGVTTKPSIRRNKAKASRDNGQGAAQEGGHEAAEEYGEGEAEGDEEEEVSSSSSKRRRR
jgi:hypothetical protein